MLLKKLRESKFVANFMFFKRFRLIGATRKYCETLLVPHFERGPGLSPVRPYVNMALLLRKKLELLYQKKVMNLP
jgi:hypothetical protein